MLGNIYVVHGQRVQIVGNSLKLCLQVSFLVLFVLPLGTLDLPIHSYLMMRGRQGARLLKVGSLVTMYIET